MSQTHLEALRQRAVAGMLHCAQTQQHGWFVFWQGYTKALSDALAGAGQAMAAKDAPSGYEPPAHLKAAWAALPECVEALTIAEVQQLLAAQGIEVATESVTDLNVLRGQELKDAEVTAVHLDDEHAAAVVDGDDGTGLHGGLPGKACDAGMVVRSEAGAWDRVERLQAFLAQHSPLNVAQLPAIDITKMETVLVWACKFCWRMEDRRASHWRECPDLHFTAGAQNTLYLLLQQLGVIPVGPFGRSIQELLRRLAAVRHQQPEGFEHLSVAQAFEWFRQHGIELTLDEVPGLQLYLAAGRKHKGVPTPVSTSAKADQKDLSVGADALNGAGVHVSTPKSGILAEEGGAA